MKMIYPMRDINRELCETYCKVLSSVSNRRDGYKVKKFYIDDDFIGMGKIIPNQLGELGQLTPDNNEPIYWMDRNKGIGWVQHSWNKYGDSHFDLSVEVREDRSKGGWTSYNELQTCNNKLLREYNYKTNGQVLSYLKNDVDKECSWSGKQILNENFGIKFKNNNVSNLD